MAKPGFYNENRNRAYPIVFCPAKMLRNCDGSLFDLPDDVLVDFGALMGLYSEYVEAEHIVYLAHICRIEDVFIFEFRSTAPGTFGTALFFTRNLEDDLYVTEDVEDAAEATSLCSLSLSSFSSEDLAGGSVPSLPSLSTSVSSEISLASDDCPEEPIWDGYLVTGTMETLATILPSGCTLSAGLGEVRVEPALIRSLAGHYVRTVNLANDDRTRAEAPDGCPDLEYSYATGETYIQAECIVGRPRMKAGYNAVIYQDNLDNSITIGASVGAGEGEPCEEIPLFAEEVPPAGRTTLDGAERCNETIRSINGVGGRILNLRTGIGASQINVPDKHKIIIDVDMNGLAVCFSDQPDNPSDASFDSC